MGFVQEFVEESERQVIRTDLTYKRDSSMMEVAVIGKPLSANDQIRIREKLKKTKGLENTRFIVHQAGSMDGDMMLQLNTSLQTGIVEDILQRNERELLSKNETIFRLQKEVENVYLGIEKNKTLRDEIRLQYPQIEKFALINLIETGISPAKADTIPTVMVQVKARTSAAELEKFRKWLSVRLDQKSCG